MRTLDGRSLTPSQTGEPHSLCAAVSDGLDRTPNQLLDDILDRAGFWQLLARVRTLSG